MKFKFFLLFFSFLICLNITFSSNICYYKAGNTNYSPDDKYCFFLDCNGLNCKTQAPILSLNTQYATCELESLPNSYEYSGATYGCDGLNQDTCDELLDLYKTQPSEMVGTLDYPSLSCTPDDCDSYNLGHGVPLPPKYSLQTVSYGGTCGTYEANFTCTNGELYKNELLFSGTVDDFNNYKYSTCYVEDPKSCTVDNVVYEHDDLISRYLYSEVPYNKDCIQVSFICNDGTVENNDLSNSKVPFGSSHKSCVNGCEGDLENGFSVTKYSKSEVEPTEFCETYDAEFVCDDGKIKKDGHLSSYDVFNNYFGQCSKKKADCSVNFNENDFTIKHGASQWAYEGSQNFATSCDYVKFSCNDGSLTKQGSGNSVLALSSTCHLDTDGDQVLEKNYSEGIEVGLSQKDLCVERGPLGVVIGQEKYSGCSTPYILDGVCEGSQKPSFDESTSTLACSAGSVGHRDRRITWIPATSQNPGAFHAQGNIEIVKGRGSIEVNRGSGYYQCSYDGFWGEDVNGYCKVKYTVSQENYCKNNGVYTLKGESQVFYSKPVVALGESCSDYKFDLTCNSGDQLSLDLIQTQKLNLDTSTFSDLEYNFDSGLRFLKDLVKPIPVNVNDYNGLQKRLYTSCIELPEDFKGVNFKDGKLDLIEEDDEVSNKIYYNLSSDDLTLTLDNTKVRIEKPVVDKKYNISIYKEGELNRTEQVDPVVIALKAHKVRKLKTKVETENFIQDSVDLMQKFNIVKDLSYDSINDRTNVKIKLDLSSLSQADKVNLTIYQVISKDYAQDFDDLNINVPEGATLTVVDKDPVIGWHFEDPEDDTEIEYDLPGDNEGGTIIITQDPILFNEGELVINYREAGCSAGEVHLFDLASLEDSLIYERGTEKYQVCVDHLIVDLYQNPLHERQLHTFDNNLPTFAWSGQFSYNYSQHSNELNISTDNEEVYWDLRIQETNPNGNYSCLGSVNDLVDSLFGDCGYNEENRIWLHLGADYFAPEVDIQVPFVAHSVKVTMIAKDVIGGSGINSISYCISEDENCNPLDSSSNTVFVNNGEEEIKIVQQISCPYDWGCLKYINYIAYDKEGNTLVGSYPLTLLDVNSACQADCTAQPTPGRYLKECRKLNACEYYDDNDGGQKVAEACHLHTKNAYVDYNDDYEIQCPLGPIRPKTFTNIQLAIDSNCRALVSNTYPAILDGQTIQLHVYSCLD